MGAADAMITALLVFATLLGSARGWAGWARANPRAARVRVVATASRDSGDWRRRPGWVEVRLPGRVDTVALSRSEHRLLQAARFQLGTAQAGTRVVFVPSANYGTEDFDATIGALSVLGLHSFVAPVSPDAWHKVDRRLRQALADDAWSKVDRRLRHSMADIDDTRRLLEERLVDGIDVLTEENLEEGIDVLEQSALGWALHPIFDDLEAASEAAGLHSCDRLVLVGCEDAAWVLQAYLAELVRLGLAPDVPVTLVALAQRKSSLLAHAVSACVPNKVDGIKYLAMAGHTAKRPKRQASPVGAAKGSLSVPDSVEALSCFHWAENEEECLVQPVDWSGETEAWFGQPTSVLNWIVKCL